MKNFYEKLILKKYISKVYYIEISKNYLKFYIYIRLF